MMPEVSIIMPVYNKARYLADALESVCKQTFSDIELILIDDGSVDGSLAIAQRFSKEDARIKIYAIPNGGVSHARNKGLSHANGRYITFMDADDTIHPLYIENLYQCIQENCADLVISGIAKYKDGSVCAEMTCGRVGLYAFQNILADFASVQKQCGIYGSCVAKMFSRELAKNICFDERLRLAEDFDFYLRLYAKVETVYCDNKLYYFYLQDTENSSFQLPDNQIDYEAQLAISLRYRAFLQQKQVYQGENRSIVDEQISNYVYATLFHCPSALLSARFDAVRARYLKGAIVLCPNGLRQRVVLGLFRWNMKTSLRAMIAGYRILKNLLKRA